MNKSACFIISVCIISFVFIGSCKKKDQTPQISQQDYPMNVGDKWVYQVTDNLTSVVDTQTITVTNKTVYNNDSIVYNTQTNLNGVVTDSSVVISSPNAYIYSSSAPDSYYSLFKNLAIKFPITSQSVWQSGEGGYYSDSIYVLYTNKTEVVFNNTYTDVYEIKRQQIGVSNNVIGLIYIAPKIGIIYQNINVNVGYPMSNQTIRLISYQLN